jgi:RNA polymerase-binding transcription factor DksA
MATATATAADILGHAKRIRIPARWGEHYRKLCAERDRLLSRDSTSPVASSIGAEDPNDAANEEYQRDIFLATATATHDTLFEILEAIHRIETGCYGICEATGQPIEPQRLRALPWTRYSLRGQKLVEDAGYGRRAVLPSVKSLRSNGEWPNGHTEEEEIER